MFILQNVPQVELRLPGLQVDVLRVDAGVAEYELTLEVFDGATALQGRIEYATALFDESTIARMSSDLRRVMAALVGPLERPVHAVLPRRDREKRAQPRAFDPRLRDRAGAGELPEYVAPRTPMEELLASIWGEILEHPQVGIRDDFFTLGGHSLLAMQVVARLRTALGVEVPVQLIFEASSVEELATELLRAEPAAVSETETSVDALDVREVWKALPGS